MVDGDDEYSRCHLTVITPTAAAWVMLLHVAVASPTLHE
jgi:hypothetical protein